jgi:hypothetical protein
VLRRTWRVGCTVTIRRSADCSHTMFCYTWRHDVRRLHPHTNDDSALGVCWTTVRSAPQWSWFQGRREVLGWKLLNCSLAIQMSFPSFNDLLHLKLGHGSFHPRLNQFTIHWHHMRRCMTSLIILTYLLHGAESFLRS